MRRFASSSWVATAVALMLAPALPATALAAAPVASTDSIKAAPTGAQDVLGNDFDPDGDALELVSATAPAHGTVRCTALGACLYRAEGDYTGPDAFSYELRDAAGETATGEVDVVVEAQTSALALVARDDRAATSAGAAKAIDVLANDSGPAPLAVTAATAPVHGTASCDPGGSCLYTPEDGFTGSDAFEYTVEAAGGAQRDASVRVLVVPAGAGFTAAMTGAPADPGTPDALAPGGSALWQLVVRSTPAGLGNAELGGLPLPAATVKVGGPHGVQAESVSTARGWDASGQGAGTGELQLTATGSALLGDQSSTDFPRPLPPVSQGTGGDGHVPILVGTKVFAFFHHASPTSVTCVDRETGEVCPGYPKQLQFDAANRPGPAAVSGTRMWVHLSRHGGYTQSKATGLFCWDAATDATCGLSIVARSVSAPHDASAPVLVGGRVWFGGDSGLLYCIDPATGDPCPEGPIETGLGVSGGGEYDVVTHGTRVFVARQGAGVACVDVDARSRCNGWETPKAFGSAYNILNQRDATGAVIGICAIATGSGTCVPDADPTASTAITGVPQTDDYYSSTLEGEVGTRTFFGSLGQPGLGCFDWTTMAPCAGGGFTPEGRVDRNSDGTVLPSAYGAAFDGSCLVGLGDPGQVFTVDPSGSAPCLSLRSGAEATSVDLRDQRCDGTVGGAGWLDVSLADVEAGELSSVVVTIRDKGTGEVLATGDVLAGPLDLSAIDPAAHPAVTVDANARSAAGNPAWADGIPPRLLLRWRPDPRTLCFATTAADECGPPATVPVDALARLTATGAESRAELVLRHRSCAPLRPCSTRPVVLEDVVPAGRKVKLLGFADLRFVGRRVAVVFKASRKVVARARVRADGSFKTTAPMPARRLRKTNRARYVARIGKERSLALKLFRRMVVTGLRAKAGKVTIRGRVIRPLAKRRKDRTIVLQRLVTCTKGTTVARFKPRRSGAFKVTVPAPAEQAAAVYRLRTKVRSTRRSKKLSDTFTLPRTVNFR